MAEARQSTHSLGTSALVARKCTSIFYRSLGKTPGLCFYVSTAPHSLLIKAVSYQREYTHTFFFLKGLFYQRGASLLQMQDINPLTFFFCFLEKKS